jgi:hypothetical protein
MKLIIISSKKINPLPLVTKNSEKKYQISSLLPKNYVLTMQQN